MNTDPIKQTIQRLLPEIIAIRHELHEHPEIRFEEKWTSDRIARYLAEAGIEHTRGHAKGTGIVAIVRGAAGKTVALRADMDALEIEEETGVSYRSQIPNRMHACGHDGHSANLCGVAKLLQQHRDRLRGTVKFIFQPAEENAAGGRFIVQEGLLDDVDAVFGLHCWPTLAVGTVGFKPGAAMASADTFTIRITGKGCHGADPGAGVDPIMVASYIVTALQTLVSREMNPWEPSVVTIARIEAGFASNVIPETATMDGTFRALTPKVRARLHEGIERIAVHTAEAHRATAMVHFHEATYPPLHNDPAMTAFARTVAQDAFGDDAPVDIKVPTMGAEDFAYYLEKRPGCFLFLGNNPSKTEPYPALHNPRFNFNDDALPYGMELMARIAIDYLESH